MYLDLDRIGKRLIALSFPLRIKSTPFRQSVCLALGCLEAALAVLCGSQINGPCQKDSRRIRGTSDTLPASVQDVGVKHRRFQRACVRQFRHEYEIHPRLRNVS